MANFNEILDSILGVLFIIVVMSLAYAYLKPHRLHKRRLVSTITLKISYLAFLLNLLIFTYIAILFKGGINKVFPGIESYLYIMLVVAPTIGIFMRKAKLFSERRDSYNYFFSVVNILSLMLLFFMFFV